MLLVIQSFSEVFHGQDIDALVASLRVGPLRGILNAIEQSVESLEPVAFARFGGRVQFGECRNIDQKRNFPHAVVAPEQYLVVACLVAAARMRKIQGHDLNPMVAVMQAPPRLRRAGRKARYSTYVTVALLAIRSRANAAAKSSGSTVKVCRTAPRRGRWSRVWVRR